MTQEISGDFVKQFTVGQVSVSVPKGDLVLKIIPKPASCCSGPSEISEETKFSGADKKERTMLHY